MFFLLCTPSVETVGNGVECVFSLSVFPVSRLLGDGLECFFFFVYVPSVEIVGDRVECVFSSMSMFPARSLGGSYISEVTFLCAFFPSITLII